MPRDKDVKGEGMNMTVFLMTNRVSGEKEASPLGKEARYGRISNT